MSSKSPENINYRLMECSRVEELYLQVHEAIMDDDSEEIYNAIHKLQCVLAVIKKENKPPKE